MKLQASNLIIVAGHAPFKASVTSVPADVADDKYWVLQSFQHGEPPFYIEHIQRGVQLLRNDPDSLLLMSGGRTRMEAGRWSEAATYQAIAAFYDYWQTDQQLCADVEQRVELEAFARDSFENLECSLYRFYELTGRYPSHVTAVGWTFKAPRFDLHRRTLGIPAKNFTYIGCNNPDDVADALVGEERTVAQFKADPHGTHPPLSLKRAERNPFALANPYTTHPPIVIT